MKAIGIFLFLLTIQATVSSQIITMETTLEYINQKLAPKYVVDVKKGLLKLDCFENGKIMRHDEIELISLEAESIAYHEIDKQVVLKCKYNQAYCIERELYQVNKKTQVSRCAIEVIPDGKSEFGLAKAFMHLSKLIQYSKYKSEEWFE